MADDPNRDIWPVREGSLCLDTYRSNIDTRERHIVCKLDRYQLEDKYLRLLEEANNLKKLSNSQEDKIKKLLTKLTRVTANSRACPAVLDICEGKGKIVALEIENSKLKDKISVLRNQLLSHTIGGRSSSRSRNPMARSSSGRITCRSESSRTKVPSCHCIAQTTSDDNNARNSLEKIQELEAQKEEMSERMAQLEKELSSCSVVNQKQKIAENVEYIKVWRQMKQLNDKLTVTESENVSLIAQLNDLKRIVEEKTKYSEEVTSELLVEKRRVAEVDQQTLKAKESDLLMREKDDRIKDLMNEMRILQQHNNELIALSSKYGDVESENKELKKKINEQFQGEKSVKTTFSNEHANIVALQSSNEQLLGKLDELQKNIDTLAVQLTSFQTQTEKQEASMGTQISTKLTSINIPITTGNRKLYKEIATQLEKCNKCCGVFENILQGDIADRAVDCRICSDKTTYATNRPRDLIDKSVQTDSTHPKTTVTTREQCTSIMTPVKECKKPKGTQTVSENVDATSTTQTVLTSEKMLKLLEQAQINPATGFSTKSVDCNMLDQDQRHSDRRTVSQVCEDSATFQGKCQRQETKEDSVQSQDKQLANTNQLLTALFDMLQEQPLICTSNEGATLYRPTPPFKCQFSKDPNNNIVTALENVKTGASRTCCTARKSCSVPHTGLHQEKLKKKFFSGVKKYNRPSKFPKPNNCTCDSSKKCNASEDCQGRCCGTSNSSKSSNSEATKMHAGIRQLQDESKPFKSWERGKLAQENTICNGDQTLHEYVKHLDKCRDLVNSVSGIPVKAIMDRVKVTCPSRYRNGQKQTKIEGQKTESCCSTDCPSDCIEITSSPSGSFPLVIADGQGLLELHIVSLQLSTTAKQILFQEDISSVSLFLSWDMWNQETAYTPTLKCPKLNFNSSFVYPISNLFSFFNFVLLEFLIFQVNIFHENNEGYAVARGKLCIKDILDYPQNKLYYIAPVNSVIPCSIGMNFGQLSLWVRLSCDVEQVEEFTKKRKSQWDTTEIKTVSKQMAFEEIGDTFKDDLAILQSRPMKNFPVAEPSEDIVFSEEQKSPHQTNGLSDSSREVEVQEKKRIPSGSSLTLVKETEEEALSSEQFSPDAKYITDYHKTIYGDKTNWAEESSENTDNSFLARTMQVINTPKQGVDHSKRTLSKTKFNDIISNEELSEVNEGDSNETINEVTNVISDKNWRKYKQRSLITFNGAPAEPGNVTDIESLADFVRAIANLFSNRTTFAQKFIKQFLQPLEKDTIIIEIVNLVLLPKSFLMQNDEYQLLYIEYSFLGYYGANMETASVKKPRPPNRKLTYNFKRKFRVDEEYHALQRNILRTMMDHSDNPNIKFVVVCEPLPEETDIRECVEVGFANFNIRDFALGDIEKVVTLPVYSMDESEQIGLLKICVLGRDTLRQHIGKGELGL